MKFLMFNHNEIAISCSGHSASNCPAGEQRSSWSGIGHSGRCWEVSCETHPRLQNSSVCGGCNPQVSASTTGNTCCVAQSRTNKPDDQILFTRLAIFSFFLPLDERAKTMVFEDIPLCVVTRQHPEQSEKKSLPHTSCWSWQTQASCYHQTRHRKGVIGYMSVWIDVGYNSCRETAISSHTYYELSVDTSNRVCRVRGTG